MRIAWWKQQTPRPRRYRRRHHIRKEVYWVLICVIILVYRNLQFKELIRDVAPPQQAVFLRESRKSYRFSDFVAISLNLTDSSKALLSRNEAIQGRERILNILEKDLGLQPLTATEILTLPKWSQVQNLYGSEPVILGLETCSEFQSRVPLSKRHIGVAGNFNTGTTAFGLSLQANCRYPNRHPDASKSNKAVTNIHGMLNQVPWAKHKMASERDGHTILETVSKDHVLPVVMVRDPYYWLQSMCRQGYGVRWDHNSKKHCPNLIPNDFDRKRFPKLQNASTVPVWMGASIENGPHWRSMIHYWNAWYRSYYQEKSFPRLIIRFEDTLFHPEVVMRHVCHCGGGIYSGSFDAVSSSPTSFRHIIDEAKWEHKHSQHNLVSAIIKYGSDLGRYRQMTTLDLRFARETWDKELIEAFRYNMTHFF
jgi:hypothetical protein